MAGVLWDVDGEVTGRGVDVPHILGNAGTVATFGYSVAITVTERKVFRTSHLNEV